MDKKKYYTPEINKESFRLTFKKTLFHVKDTPYTSLSSNSSIMKNAPWYFKWFGFYYKYHTKIVSGPEPIGNDFSYEMKLDKVELYWFNIKLKTYK